MEIIIVIAVIAAFCIIFGISMDAVVIAAAAFGGITEILMLLFFSRFMFTLIFSKKKKAIFLKIDKPPGSKFKSAFYMIGDKEYPCFFPSEIKSFYKQNKQYSVFLHEKTGRVFDRFSVITCILGYAFSLYLFISIIVHFKEMI